MTTYHNHNTTILAISAKSAPNDTDQNHGESCPKIGIFGILAKLSQSISHKILKQTWKNGRFVISIKFWVKWIWSKCRHHWRSVLLRVRTRPVILCIYRKVPFGAGFAERSQELLYFIFILKIFYLFSL